MVRNSGSSSSSFFIILFVLSVTFSLVTANVISTATQAVYAKKGGSKSGGDSGGSSKSDGGGSSNGGGSSGSIDSDTGDEGGGQTPPTTGNGETAITKSQPFFSETPPSTPTETAPSTLPPSPKSLSSGELLGDQQLQMQQTPEDQQQQPDHLKGSDLGQLGGSATKKGEGSLNDNSPTPPPCPDKGPIPPNCTMKPKF